MKQQQIESENEEMVDVNVERTVLGKTSLICINQWNLQTYTIDYSNQDIATLLQQISQKLDLPYESLRLT